jgi:3-hydroxyisobutyrate dehydrogenase-like beta-hydroxyacid dehydrogenase
MADLKRVGMIGLGAMGLPMAKRLLSGGFDLSVLPHRNMAPADELVSIGARRVTSHSELAEASDVLITMVPDVPQVQEVLFGEGGLAQTIRSGALYIDMSTVTPAAAREYHSRLGDRGVLVLDAPVSGGPMRASDGTLTIMVGGSKEAFEIAQPVLSVLGKQITHVGGPGAGQVVKLANQLMISIIMIANAEALTLGVKAGIPLETLVEVIGTSSGSNYLMQSWLPKTLFSGDLNSGFALDLLLKDLNAALLSSKEMGVPAFGGALAQQLYLMARTEAGGRVDYSAVAELYEHTAGVELRLPKDH